MSYQAVVASLLLLSHLSFAQAPTSEQVVLSGYGSVSAVQLKGNIYYWSESQAVSQNSFELNFARGRGWYLLEKNSEGRHAHAWRDHKGCHRFELNVLESSLGYIEPQHSTCDESVASAYLPDSMAESLLSWLHGQQGKLIDLRQCEIQAQELRCKQDGIQLFANLSAGRIQRAVYKTLETGYVQSIEIEEVSANASALKLAPDFKALGVFTIDPESDVPSAVFAKAAAGDAQSARKALMYLISNQIDEVDPAQVFRAIEAAYRAKVPMADYYSAQFYAAGAAEYRPAVLQSWDTKRLREEFEKRMKQAADACNFEALSITAEGCYEMSDMGCEGGSAMTAFFANQKLQACEAAYVQQRPKAKRLDWTRRKFD